MDISRRQSNEDTTTSMYLSFDAESTMSTTACYKTLEAMNDTSVLSCMDINDLENQNKCEDVHINSTLELNNNFHDKSPLKTVKKVEFQDVKLNTPLRALQKNILKEYKALCSTPSKEQLLKTVDVTRGSDATRCADLGLAFLGIDDENPANFPPASVTLLEENKENALPDSEEVSTLSAYSSVEITTVIEKKMLTSVSTVGSISEEESAEEANNADKEKISFYIVDKSSNVSLVNNANNFSKTETEYKTENLEKKPEAKIKDINNLGIITETQEKKTPLAADLEIPNKNNNTKSFGGQSIAVLAKKTRRSICEPNLKTNKPSRICNIDIKRRSYLPTCKSSTLSMDAETEIPLLMNKMLKISKANMEPKKNYKEEKLELNQESSATAENIHNTSALKNPRTSLIPAAAGNKRAFGFTQRMSVVVKTTLNSPARKITRRSLISGPMSSFQRKSVIPQKTTSADHSKIKQIKMFRKSMAEKTPNVYITTQPTTKTLDSLKESCTKTFPQRKSLYSAKTSEKVTSIATSVASQTNKTDTIQYNCNVCKEKFRIKSLLDAHKRSHESDNKPPAFIKKTSSTKGSASGTMLGNLNQCKYCDKKFALLKALHIHLLQNCSKIPPSEKRKLQFTELNHVEKAQLPKNVFSHHNLQRSASSTVFPVNETPRNSLKQNNNTSTKSSSESLNKNRAVQKATSDISTIANGGSVATTQNTAPKLQKISAHSGVYKTPSKLIPCYLCKLTFKSILDYTNHNLTAHGDFNESVAENKNKIYNANIY